MKSPYPGNPNAKPLLEVVVTDLEPGILNEMTDEDARREGFASLDAYKIYWDRIYYHKAIYFEKNRFRPIWITTFKFKSLFPSGQQMMERLEKELKAKADKK
ncbi:MAG: ASCH domain-containing protein [Planctomycetota bacterium]